MPALTLAWRLVCTALLLAPQGARADLYRWVDAETGSIKYSNHPPLVSSATRGPAPAVNVIVYRPPGSAAPIAEKTDQFAAKPAVKPPSAPALAPAAAK
jgi:hypothetical protein